MAELLSSQELRGILAGTGMPDTLPDTDTAAGRVGIFYAAIGLSREKMPVTSFDGRRLRTPCEISLHAQGVIGKVTAEAQRPDIIGTYE